MNHIDYPDAARRLINDLNIAGVTEIALDDNIKLSTLLEANNVSYNSLIFDENFRSMRKSLHYPVIEEHDTLGQMITKIHNAMYKD